MDETTTIRESRSVRLADDEWAVAEAIGRLSAGRPTAGQGIREALLREAERLATGPDAERYLQALSRARAQRAARGTR